MAVDLEKMMADFLQGMNRLEESQAKTDAQLARTDAQLAKTDALLAKTVAQLAGTDARLEGLFAETDARLKKRFEETDARLEQQRAETDAKFNKQRAETDAKFDKQRAESDARFDKRCAKTDAMLDKLGQRNRELAAMYGGMSEHLGDETELDFFAALRADPTLADVHYDDVTYDVTRKDGRGRVQLDLFLTNGDNVAIVEVKRHLQSSHVERLHEQTIPMFRILFPEFLDKNLYAAFATYGVPSKAKKYVAQGLEKYGYGLLTLDRDGTRFHVDDHAMRVIP